MNGKSVNARIGAREFVIVALASFAMSVNASAGTVLRLQAGTISLESGAKAMFSQAFSDEAPVHGKRAFIVQLKDRVTEGAKARLAALGAEPRGYLPDDALIVEATDADIEALSLLPEVNAVAHLAAEWKVSAELLAPSRSATAARADYIRITTLHEGNTAEIARQLENLPGVAARIVGEKTIVAKTSRSNIHALAKVEGIEWIQEMPAFVTMDYFIHADPPAPTTPPALTGYESGTKIMNFDASWKRGFRGEGQIAGMGDTGVDSGDPATMHQDLAGVFKGYPLGWGAKTWEDLNGHGTHVCGSVIGNGKALNGSIRGGAYMARMVVDGLWSPIMNNLAFKNDFVTLLDAPYADGVRIHTNSWGSASNLGAYDSFAAQADAYMFSHPDILVIFAAGNDGQDKNKDGRIDENSIASPGTAKNVLTVGASENLLAEGGIQKKLSELRGGKDKWGVAPLADDLLSNDPNGMAAFSSRGPTRDGRLKPDVVAPGTNIVSVLSQNPKAGKLWGEYNKDYAYSGGTSMATPLTAGAATVAREYLIETQGLKTPSAAIIKGVLMHTAFDMYPGQYGLGPKQELPTRRPNVHEGYGRVDMDKATDLDGSLLADEKAGVATGETKTYSVNVTGGKLRATLVYTDAAGSPTAAKALVNDLDLQITGPAGKTFEKADRTNNSEMLELEGLPSGQYKITVKGINVPQGKDGKQPYALLVTAL